MSTLVYYIQPAESLEPPPTEWTRTYGGTSSDYARSLIETSDGGYAMAGYTRSFGAGVDDFWLIKTDSYGLMQWNQTYGGVDHDFGMSVIQTVDEGYAIAGSTNSYGIGTESNFWLVKIDSSGNHQWNRTYGGIGSDVARSIVQTSDGGYALAGPTRSFGAGGNDFWLVKTDSAGNVQWNQTYGSLENDYVDSLIQTSDGGYALAGYTEYFGAGSFDFWLVKTYANGSMQWNRTYGGPSMEAGHSLVQTGDSGYAIAGSTHSFGPGDSDSYLVKTDSNGNMQWNQTYGGTGPDGAHSVVQTVDGGYAMAGCTESFDAGSPDFWLIKTDENGNMLWNHTYGGPYEDVGYSIVQTSDDGYAMAGYTYSFGAGGGDFWLVKTACGNPPVANFTYSPSNPIVNCGITFNASSSYDLDEDIASYRWNFDDGNISSTANSTIIHSYDSTGSYNVTLTVIDSKGLNHSYSQTVWVRIATSISISTSSTSTYIGFKVNVTGSISDMYGTPLRNQTVAIHYTPGGIDTWTPIASDSTDDLGNYHVVWIPSATGYFVLKAEWLGNATHFGTNITTMLSSLAYNEQYVFSVESNSTISELAFESTSRELSFNVSGPSDTTGYVDVCISKTLIENVEDVEVKLNGEEMNYTASSSDDSWLLHFTYLHSTHRVTISLGSISGPFETPTGIIIAIPAIAFIALVILIVLYFWRKKQSH